MTHSLNWRQSNGLLWLACVLCAVLWDFLFWGEPVGISAAIFAAVLCAGLVMRLPALWRFGEGRVVVVLAFLAVAALVEETTRLGILMVVVAVGMLALVGRREVSLLHDTVSAWLGSWLRFALTLWTRVLLDNALVARWLFRHPQISRRFMRVATAVAWWVLPVFAGLLFLGLFALANPVIAQGFMHVGDWLAESFDWLLTLSFSRIILWGVVIVVVYGLLRHRSGRRAAMRVPPVAGAAPSALWLTGPQMVVRLLLVMNAVFAVENVLDAMYLYGGLKLPAGVSHTEYAHRGAYTLIVTALLAGVFTLGAFRHNGTAQRSRACRWLVYAWIGQNIALLVSTIWRAWIYVDEFQLTRLRLSTMIWCGLVASGFVWIILRIKYTKTNAWLWRMNAFTTAGLLLACTFINFDGIIARYNVRHCREMGGQGQALDVAYLEGLGPQALPALREFRAHGPAEGSAVEGSIRRLDLELAGELADWRGWTFRRWRVAAEGGAVSAAVVRRGME